MLLPLVLAAALMPATLPGSHGVCAANNTNNKKHVNTEKDLLADIDKHISAVGGILAKQPAPLGDAAAHFTAIGTDAAQVDTTGDFMKKDAAAQKQETVALKTLTQAANRAAAASHGSAKDAQAALDAVKAARADIGGKAAPAAPAKKK